MAFDRAVTDVVNDLLSYYDIQGPPGSELLPVRTTILVVVKDVLQHGFKTTLVADQYSAEGMGIHSFWKTFLQIPQDAKIAEGIHIAWESHDVTPPKDQLTWMRNVVDLGSFPETYTCDTQSFWMPLRCTDSTPQTLHHLELFAGGFGGWSSALRLAMKQIGKPCQSVGIDHDHHVARSFALTHHAAFIKPCGMLPKDLFDSFQGTWIVCSDIVDFSWCQAVANWGVDFVSISFPCGPWSGATCGPGLADTIGQLLFHAVLQTRFLRPQCIGFENVSGFHRHDQKPLLARLLLMVGYRLVWEATVDVQNTLGLVRPRWLALAVRVNGPPCPLPLKPWPHAHQPIDHARFVMPFTPGVQALILTEQAWTLATDKQYLPWKLIKKQLTPKEVLDTRTYSDTQVLPTFMARYGFQHQLPAEHLAKFGYMAHFRQESPEWPFGVRYWHPAEVALLHGTLDSVFIDKDFSFAWMVMGNLITVPHAAMVTLPAVELILNMECSRDDFMHCFQDIRMTAAHIQTSHTEHGMFLTPEGTLPTPDFLLSVPDLFALDHDGDLWFPNEGKMRLGKDGIISDAIAVKPLKIDGPKPDHCIDVHSSPEKTLPFAIMKQVFWNLPIPQTLEFAVDLPSSCVEQLWFGDLKLLPSDNDPNMRMELVPRPKVENFVNHFDNITIPVLHQGKLVVFRVDPNEPLCQQVFTQDLPSDLYDLFGPLHLKQTPTDLTLISTFRLQHGQFAGDLLGTFQNFGRVSLSFSWISQSDTYCIQIQGPVEFARPVLDFWTQVLTPTTLRILGRNMTPVQNACGFQLLFEPSRHQGVCPPKMFRLACAIAAFRMFMDALPLNAEIQYPVAIKWMKRTLWEGLVAAKTNIGIIIQFLKFGLSPMLFGDECRLVFRGKQIPFDAPMQQIDWISTETCNKITVIPSMRGGASSKQQQRIYQQSALASTMLEFGYELPWITSTCETLINKFSMAKIQHVTSQTSSNVKITSILALCKEAGIDIPSPTKPTSRQPQGSTPWRPKKARGDEAFNPQDYQILPGFFTNQDGTPVEQIQTVKPQTAGICMLLPAQATPFMTGEQLSSDELGVLVVGSPSSPSDADMQRVVFPCWNVNNQMVLITGYLIQLGARHIQIQKGDAEQIKAEACSLVALTTYRSDWSDDNWVSLTTKPIPFLRELFAKAGMEQTVLSIWGKSLRSGRAAASPHQAETMQVHCSIVNEKLHRFLSKSGFNSVYATPKQADGRLDASFRIIWLNEDAQSASIRAMKTQNCLGLVKGRNTLGLRYLADDYDKAWQTLCPDQEKPQFVTGDLMYKAEGLPFGCTAKVVAEWTSKLGWTCSPIRALGPNSWLLRAASHPEPGVKMFNSSPILLRFLQPRMVTQSPVVIGPKVTKSSTDVLQQPAFDPWANWTGPKVTPQPQMRSLEGPIESRLAAQDEKIANLQQSLDKVTKSQESLVTDATKRFEHIEQVQEANMQVMTKTIDNLKHELDGSLKHVMQQSTQLFDARLTELKQLLSRPQKRDLEPNQDAMGDWLGNRHQEERLSTFPSTMPRTHRPNWSQDRSVPFVMYSIFLWSLLLLWLHFDFDLGGVLSVIHVMLSSVGSVLQIIQAFGHFVTRGMIRVRFVQSHVGNSVTEPLPWPPLLVSESLRASKCRVTPQPSFAIRFCFFALAFCEISGDRSFSHLHALRVGEALHPGPPPKFCTVAISNPTSTLRIESV